jgi:PIN domain nuclease of toxin-antitoxin system
VALLLDTHIWIWHLAGSERLPSGIKAAILEAAGDCWLSTVSLWELGLLARKGRVELAMDLRSWVDNALHRLPLKEAPLTREVAIKSLEIELPHEDPADHFLAATALVFDLTLATVDRRLLGHSWLPSISG